MRNRIIFTLIALLGVSNLYSQQFNKLGNPIVTYFAEEIGIPEQTWSVAQDLRGIMYFGTNINGILEYDGKNWRTISTNTRKVHSMAIDSTNGTMYVGLEGDFGLLTPDNTGNLYYKSLNNLIPDSIKSDVSAVYKTYVNKGKVYFCTPKNIFILKNGTISSIQLPRYSFITSICGDEIIVGNFDEGLIRIVDGKLEPDNNSTALKEKDTYAVLPTKKDENWVVTNNGIYKYNKGSNRLSSINDPYHLLQRIPNEGIIPYNASILGNGNVGIVCVNTNWLSYIEMTPNGELVNILNKNAGLEGTQITNLYQINDDPLWLTFYDGALAKVEALSPIKHFTNAEGLVGVINSVMRINGSLYIGTSNGIFQQTFINGFPSFKRINESDVWDIIDFKLHNGNKIQLVASIDGVKQLRGNDNIEVFSDTIEKVNPFAMSLLQSEKNPNRLYIGTSNAIFCIDCKNGKAENKSFKSVSKPEHNIGEVQNIAEDMYGNIWASSSTKRLVCYGNDGENFYSFENSPACQGEICPIAYDDSLFILSANGIYHFNYKDSTFVQGGIVGHAFDNIATTKMIPFNNGIIIVSIKNKEYRVDYVRKDSLGNYSFNSTPFKRLPKKMIGALYVDNDVLWMGIQKELYSFNPNINNFNLLTSNKPIKSKPYHTLIRKVEFKDSVVFNGTYFSQNSNNEQIIVPNQPEDQIPELSYRHNAVVIDYSATFFEREENTLFSHYLEGSDEKDWSKWDMRSEATYTNLREGSYTFHVKAKNVYDHESTVASFSFEIRPPWYRTILAYFFYLVLFVLFVWGLIKWNMRRLIAEKERLEKIVQERTAEVVAQKEEIEGQKTHIEEQNEEIKSSIQYASRIQRAILSPENQVNSIFPDNFILYLPRDIVSGDFYVIKQVGNKKISVVADCTGHGVPGGFMSMLGMSSLNEIINKNADNLHADIILNLLREKIITSLHQTGEVGTSKDGMDLALYILDETEMKLEYAGANNSLVIIRNNEILQVKADKMPIGIYLKGNLPFTNNIMDIYKDDVLYTFSDGYADQFGGADQRKFMIKNLKNLFLEIHTKPMSEQRDILDKTLSDWHGDSPRIDDVVVMGVRI